MDAAAWINTHVDESARVGALNAGALAYVTERTVINLDGLMNDAEFLSHLKRNTVPEYVRQTQMLVARR